MSTTPGFGSTPEETPSEAGQPEWLVKPATDGMNVPQLSEYPQDPAQQYPPQYPQDPAQQYPPQYPQDPAQQYPPQYPQPGYAQSGYPYGPGQWVPVDPYAKSRVAAGLLGIFLGSFGIHRFYLGYNGLGVTMLLITVLTCGFGAVVTSIWGLVEGILYLTDKTGSYSRDASGRPLQG